jgi:hypothetical protein
VPEDDGLDEARLTAWVVAPERDGAPVIGADAEELVG